MLSAKADFLQTSSEFLRKTGPSTSALLNFELARTLSSREDFRKRRRQLSASHPCCKACGNSWASEAGVKTWTEPIRAPPQPRKSGKARSARKPQQRKAWPTAQFTQCQRCNDVVKEISPSTEESSKPSRTSTASAERPLPSKKGVLDQVVSPSMNQNETTPSADLPNENKSAKARAKARKKGGLQAQLDKSRGTQTQKDNFGLDLMDFMSAG